MDSMQKLADLEKILDVEYKKLRKFQYRIAHTSNAAEKFDLEVRIEQEILPMIRQHEREYWNILVQEAPFCEVIEKDARNAIVEVVTEVELIQIQPNKYSDELMQKLQEILDKLNEPQTPAAAKLKVALPLVPLIMSYEVELDTEISLRRVFDRIKKIFKQAIDEKEKKTHK
ncbi:hypothetical protein Osc7112_0131 [Oscillatoria nigro-viridis PCC 7112]|uniref:Uncharacterized protein n=1 Tax=Phormidium nigroviride PCC 7112 TaxID=179408 RepID=K9VBZ7_9CYAN|nr:hypothetical protein [Oscillatoria nigro-viridis]AFZ04770.1 hypothetical protein Osc7112_0131 [Oscillatoria nigro-viridis PCC 7112]